jgi:hypothetical protein
VIKVFSIVMLGALLVVSFVPTLASALPDVGLTLAASAFPLHLSAEEASTAATFETTSGGLLKATGVKVLFSVKELAALGTFELVLENIKDGTKACNGTGDAKGTVLVTGSFHLVYTSLPPNLQLGTLYQVTEFELECEGSFYEIKGTVIGSLNGIGLEGAELTSVSGKISGTKGKQEIKEYYGDGGTQLKAALLLNPGNGFKEANLLISGEPALRAVGSDMFVITGR